MRLFKYTITIETKAHGREKIIIPAAGNIRGAFQVLQGSIIGRFLPVRCIKAIKREPIGV